MSSQKQWHRARYEIHKAWDTAERYRVRCKWLERRPPWWRFRALRRWKAEEPSGEVDAGE